MRIVLMVVFCALVGRSAHAGTTSPVSSSFLILPGDATWNCGQAVTSPEDWIASFDTDHIEHTFQRLRYAPEIDNSPLLNLLYLYLQPVVAGYLRKRDFLDHQLGEEIFHDAFLDTFARLRQARETSEPAQKFAPFFFGKVKFRSLQTRRRYHESGGGGMDSLENDYVLPYDRTQQETLFGVPLALSNFQLTVLRGLANGKTHLEVTQEMEAPPRAVHDAIGNVERNIQKALGDPSIRRSEIKFFPVLGHEHQVFIQWTRGDRKQKFVAEGTLPFEGNELRYLVERVLGKETSEPFDAERAQYLETRIMTQRRHDYHELFGHREGQFERMVEINIPRAEGEYALFRAFGLERGEIAEATATSLDVVSTRYDRLRQRIVDAMAAIDRNVDFRKMYFSLPDDSLEEICIILPAAEGKFYIVRGWIGEPNQDRKNYKEVHWVERTKLRDAIATLEERERQVASMRFLESVPTVLLASRLNIRVDSVRKHLAHATMQLTKILEMPGMNAANLRIKP